jgi:L-lactate dehydrogenase complex protein LldF
MIGLENATPLPYASSLCGACKQVCPVDIDIPRMLLDLRHDLVAAGEGPASWKLGMKLWAWAMSSPTLYRTGDKVATVATGLFQPKSLPGPLAGWTEYRTSPTFASQPFRSWWAEQQGDRDE